METLPLVWGKFFWPLLRLLCGLACGLLLANLLEALRWTHYLAKITGPLARAAHLGPEAAAAFALAFVSPSAANGLLSEKHAAGQLSLRALILANIFNGLPAWLSHMPTIFLLTWPALGIAALYYTGVTLLAALGRTLLTIFAGRFLLPCSASFYFQPEKMADQSFPDRLLSAFKNAWRRFKKRCLKLFLITAIVYALMWFCQEFGFFKTMEHWLAGRLEWLTILKPQAIGIVALQLVAEMGATLGAAGAALEDASLTAKDVVIAMLVGNVLSTPLRAIRHQLPAYAGFYKPGLALKLVLINQSVRAASMIGAIGLYAWL